MAEENDLKESVKEPVKNVVKETVSEVVRRIVKASTKKAVMELKKKLKEKAIRRLEGRLKDVAEQQLEKQLKESIKQVTKKIVKDNVGRVDFIKGIERGFEKGFKKSLSSLSKGLLKPIVITFVCLLIVGGGVYAGLNMSDWIMTKAPDLTITDITVGVMEEGVFVPKPSLQEGDNVYFKVTVKNVGDASSGPWSMKYDGSTAQDFKSLNPGQEFIDVWDPVILHQGVYTFEVDYLKAIRELDETNNTLQIVVNPVACNPST
jgi:hypothetical protein